MELDYEQSELIPLGKKKYFCIEYPGYVKRTERAINSLGGEKVLAEAIVSNKEVELKFRPGDMFSHPIRGAINPTSKLLVKVTRRIKKNKITGQVIEDPNWKIEVKGAVTKVLRFRALADFQYIVPKTDSILQLRKALVKGDVQHIIDFKVADDEESDDIRNLPPSIFTMTDIPLPYGYRQNAPVIRVRAKQPDGSYVIKLVNRSRRQVSQITLVRFHEENMPSKSWFILLEPNNQEIETIKIVSELFKERPVWSRSNLKDLMPFKYHKHLKVALVHIGYTFSDGPWRDFWVAYGIDPRSDIKYAKYQQVDIRRNFTINTTQSSLMRRKLNLGSKKIEEHIPEDRELKLFKFDGVAVPKLKATYQMIDIIDPDILPLIQNPAYMKPLPTKLSGFYYECVNKRIRVSVKAKHTQLVEKGVADRLTNLEDGLLEEIEKEKAKIAEQSGEEEEEIEATQEKENAVKEAMKAMDNPGSSKRLTEVVDEYMDELVKGEPLKDDDFIDLDTLEDYDEELDIFVEDDEDEEGGEEGGEEAEEAEEAKEAEKSDTDVIMKD